MDKTTLLSGYAAVIYVDGDIGNDTTGNGSEALPYKTILKASQSVKMDNTMIYVAREGVYQEIELTAIFNLNYKITLATVTVTDSDKKVYLQLNRMSNVISLMTKENIFVGFIIQIMTSSAQYMYIRDTSIIRLSFNNCIFDNIPFSPNTFPIRTGQTTTGVNLIKLEYVNCSLLPTTFGGANTSGLFRGDFIFCAIADSNLTPTAGNVLSAIFDDEFHLTSSSDLVGVYHGTYAWAFDNSKTLIYNDGKYKRYFNSQWDDVSIVGATPTEQEMKTLGMSLNDLKKLNREQIKTSDFMVNQGTLGSGKLFISTIDLDRHFDIVGLGIKK